VIIRSEIRNRLTRGVLERQVIDLRQQQDVTKYAHREVFSSPPDWQSALDLDVPHLALCIISMRMARLNDEEKFERVIALYQDHAKAIIERYRDMDVREISFKLFHEPNADIDFKTCVAHVYRDVGNAYIALASAQVAREKRETQGRAMQF